MISRRISAYGFHETAHSGAPWRALFTDRIARGHRIMTRSPLASGAARTERPWAAWLVLLTALVAGPASAALTLVPAKVTVAAGSSATVQISGASGEIQAESKNTAVARVSLKNATATGATLLVSGVGAGSATVYVRDAKTPNISLPVTVLASTAGSGFVYRLLATNDLGMHCVDADFSVFSILPPYNVINAQVLRRGPTGKPSVLDPSAVGIRYEAVRDAAGSINSSSLRSSLGAKTNFWTYAEALYGATLQPGQGLKGLYMPGDAPTLANRSLAWNVADGLFKAEGIPILPRDDAGFANRYPLLRLVATEKATGKDVAFLDVVAPVSEETTCSDCHDTGGTAAQRSAVRWSQTPDKEIRTRENVLLLHDHMNSTRLMVSKPVLCAQCHYSPALDLAGVGPQGNQVGRPTMSAAMHAYHGNKMQGYTDDWVRLGGTPDPQAQACYTCHPGRNTQCLRGAMTEAVNCQNCHGNMQAVGGAASLAQGGSTDGANDGRPRRPWLDLPRCQSCHTGDAARRLQLDPSLMAPDGLRTLLAFDPADPAASPRLASNPRFAENSGKLFRFSKGHGGVACEGCHNSTHAIWANPAEAHNDNVAARQLQGHTGTLSECSACHAAGSLPLTLSGPHGMHNIGDSRWTSGHEALAKSGVQACAACHGTNFRGTALSRTAASRTWNTEFGTRTVPRGQAVGCYDCHNGPNP